MHRLSDESLSTWAYIVPTGMAILGVLVTFFPPGREDPLMLALALLGFVLLGVAGIALAREQHRRGEASRKKLDGAIAALSASMNTQFVEVKAMLVNITSALPVPKQIEKANELAQEEELAKAQKELEGKIHLAAPTFMPESLAELKTRLSRVRGKVNVMALIGDTDSLETARVLAGVFREAGWAVTGVDRVGGFSVPVKGIYIQARSEKSGFAGFVQSELDSAMESAGVKTKGSIVPAMPEDEIAIIVGVTEW